MLINFGLNKISDFKQWTGKERRLLQQAVEDEVLSIETINDILVHKCDSTNRFYTQFESDFVIYNNYKICFSEFVMQDFVCNKCKKQNTAEMKIDELISNHRKNQLSTIIVDNIEFNFGTPEYSESVLGAFKNLYRQSDKLFLNMLLHISSIKINNEEVQTTKDNKLQVIEDIVEGLTIDQFDTLFNYYNDNSFLFIPSKICSCECSHKQEVLSEFLPNIIE